MKRENEKEAYVKKIMEMARTEEVAQMAREEVERYKASDESGRVLELKEQDVMNVLNASYIAQRFFGRSRSWISRKLNHHLVNGKPDDFNEEERKKLKAALDTIAYEIQILSDNL